MRNTRSLFWTTTKTWRLTAPIGRQSASERILPYFRTTCRPRCRDWSVAAFDIVCVMRERTPLPRIVIEAPSQSQAHRPSTGPVNAAIDARRCRRSWDRSSPYGYRSDPTFEFTWALIWPLREYRGGEQLRPSRGWQQNGRHGSPWKDVGILGLGRIGSQVARIGNAFGMNPVAWSQNLTPKPPRPRRNPGFQGPLFEQADILTIHLC